jgi:hypothetical protein
LPARRVRQAVKQGESVSAIQLPDPVARKFLAAEHECVQKGHEFVEHDFSESRKHNFFEFYQKSSGHF